MGGAWKTGQAVGGVFDCNYLCGDIANAAKTIGANYVDDTVKYGWTAAAFKAAVRGACALPSQIGGVIKNGAELPGYGLY